MPAQPHPAVTDPADTDRAVPAASIHPADLTERSGFTGVIHVTGATDLAGPAVPADPPALIDPTALTQLTCGNNAPGRVGTLGGRAHV